MAKPKGHSKSTIYNNHAKTGTDIPGGWEYVAEQIKDAKHYVKALSSWTHAVSTKGMSRDRGDAINEMTPSKDFEGFKPSWEWYQKEQTQAYSRRHSASPFEVAPGGDRHWTAIDRNYGTSSKPKYKNPRRIS